MRQVRAKGFTLLELMTVVVILIVLATVAVVSYKRYMARARLEAGYGYVHMLRMKEEEYYATYGMYVSTAQTLDQYYPTKFASGGVPVVDVPWNVDCTNASAGSPEEAFCALGFNPGSTVTFGLVAKGWHPGATGAPSCIQNSNKPWWVIKAITGGTRPMTSDGTSTIDCYSLRVTSEHPMNIYEAYCRECDQACGNDPCCKQDCL